MNNNKKLILERILSTIITAFLVCFIFAQSLKNADISSADSGRVTAFLNNIASAIGLGEPFSQNFVRICAHFTEFAILEICASWMFNTYTIKASKAFVFSLCFCVGVAITDECIQLFSEGRAFQLSDIFIDAAGVVCGCCVMFILRLIKFRHTKKSIGST